MKTNNSTTSRRRISVRRPAAIEVLPEPQNWSWLKSQIRFRLSARKDAEAKLAEAQAVLKNCLRERTDSGLIPNTVGYEWAIDTIAYYKAILSEMGSARPFAS